MSLDIKKGTFFILTLSVHKMKKSILYSSIFHLVNMKKCRQNSKLYWVENVSLSGLQDRLPALTEMVRDVFTFLRENCHIYVYNLVHWLVFHTLMQLKVFYKELLLPYPQVVCLLNCTCIYYLLNCILSCYALTVIHHLISYIMK